MKLSQKCKIRIRPQTIRLYREPDSVVYVCSWYNPIEGVTVKATGTTEDDALKHFYKMLKLPVYVNDLTIPWWKFWKRKYIK